MINCIMLILCYGGIIVLPFIIFKIKEGDQVKGNITKNGEKIYYVKSHRLYSKVQAEEFFRSEKSAIKAGYRAPKR